MITVGSRWSLRWPKLPHLIDVTVVELTETDVVLEARHRCGPECYLTQMRKTLPIEGRMIFRYPDFVGCFQPIAEDAIALPPPVSI